MPWIKAGQSLVHSCKEQLRAFLLFPVVLDPDGRKTVVYYQPAGKFSAKGLETLPVPLFRGSRKRYQDRIGQTIEKLHP